MVTSVTEMRGLVSFVVLLLVSFPCDSAETSRCPANFFLHHNATTNVTVCQACPTGTVTPADNNSTSCSEYDGCAISTSAFTSSVDGTCRGHCFDNNSYAFSGFSCEFFYVNGYCRDGGIGPEWNPNEDFNDYANPDNGVNPLDACCDCGGGLGFYTNDSDRSAICVDDPAPSLNFSCSCSQGYFFNHTANTCRPVHCDEDQRVLNATCVDCLPGRINVAGDNAIYGDTECVNKTCQEHEHVLNHSCVPCQQGFTNEAGDSAFGPDTQCYLWR